MTSTKHPFRILIGLCLAAFCFAASAGEFAQPRAGLHTGGQPTAEDIQRFANEGGKTVIDLRPDSEPHGFDEQATVRQHGLRYVSLPISGAGDLTPQNAAMLKRLLDDSHGPVLLHCASGNRVGALLALMANQEEGASREEALELGRKAGLKSLEPVVESRLDP